MLIEARDIVKTYSGHVALQGLNVDVEEGSVHGLLGPNGAGKTTFIRILNQMTRQDSGTLLFDGREISRDDIENIGYLPEERGLYKKMKVGEEAVYLARLRGLSRADALKRLKYWFDKFEIGEWWNKKVDELSKGMQQKVQFIVTVLHEPRLLILDEPFSGFDPINAEILKSEILQLRSKGSTILFSTHNMSSVEDVCDSITLIDKSRNVLQGKVSDIKQQYKQGHYSISFKGEPQDFATLQNVSVLQSSAKDGIANMTISADMSANELIRQLIERVELTEFRELLPSMNDIFINIVNEHKEFRNE
ncbi:MAG: ABC transporter ATP-binding protein [Marinilabiliaceae bacterium]|nr:ABC transporter ATP-binding protein [Marinilabiliaceae bacterium]